MWNIVEKYFRIKYTNGTTEATALSIQVQYSNNSDILLSFWYTFITFECWPNDRDIFTYLTKVIAPSRRSIEKMFFLMNAELQGRNLENDSGLENEMKDFVGKVEI